MYVHARMLVEKYQICGQFSSTIKYYQCRAPSHFSALKLYISMVNNEVGLIS